MATNCLAVVGRAHEKARTDHSDCTLSLIVQIVQKVQCDFFSVYSVIGRPPNARRSVMNMQSPKEKNRYFFSTASR